LTLSASQPETLKLVALVTEGITQSQIEPGLWRYPLKLSSPPPLGWAPILRDRYRRSSWAHARTISVEGNCVIVDCLQRELQPIIDDLKPIIAETNVECDAQQQQFQAAEQQLQRERARQAQDHEDLAKRLKF
jgi:hypothetical protein